MFFGGSGVTQFTRLTDAPSTYVGSGLKHVRVNATATGLEFAVAGSGAFVDLTDVPATYSGQALKGLRVNASETALEFVTGSGTVAGPGSSTAGHIVTFADTTGEVIQDSGYVLPTGSILGTTDSQSVTNKSFNNTNTFSTKDSLFTLEQAADATALVVFSLASISTATTRTITVPDASFTMVGLTTSQTVTNKTLDNTTTLTIKDANFTIQDDSDTSKQAKFQASSISGSTTRTITLQDASGTMYITGGTDVAVADGGTGASTATAGFDNLSPMTTLGDMIYGGASGTRTRVAGNTTAVKQFLSQTGDGAASAAPSWATLVAANVSDFDTQVRTSKVHQLAAPTSSFSMNSQRITSLANAVDAQDAVTKADLDAVAAGLLVKNNCRVATTANITIATALNSGDTIDGVVLAGGDRVLVKDQTAGEQNGIYVVDASPFRSTDFDTSAEVLTGAYTFITAGTVSAGYGYYLTTPATITLDTTALTFTQFIGANVYIAGAGLTLSGLTFAIGAGTGITVNSDSIEIDTAVVVTLTGSQTLTNKTLTAPNIGAATATSINGLTITASTGTLTITNGKTLSVSNTLTFTGTDSSSVAFGAGGTVAYVANKLSVFAATSSSELAGVISDETGTGALVFGTAPTFASSITVGTASSATGTILLKGTTSGTVTLSVADGAGTWTMKLPSDAGTSGYVLRTDGSGNTSWVAQSAGGGSNSVEMGLAQAIRMGMVNTYVTALS